MAIGDVPLTPIIDPVTGTVTEIGRIYLRTLATAVGALAPVDALYWVSRGADILTAEVNLGALASGYLKLATAVGIATPATVTTIPQADITGLAATLAGLAPLASPAFTGTPTAPTAAPGTNTTQIATTAMVQAAQAGLAQLASGNSFTGPQTVAGDVTLTGAAQAALLRLNTASDLLNGVATILSNGAVRNGISLQNTNAGNAIYFLAFYNSGGGLAGGITQNGASGVLYNTSSDARLKDDAGPATDLAALRAVVVHDFAWKADGVRDRGVFAQEAHAHYPRAVTPGTDETTDAGTLARPWLTDYSKFVADLIVGWQQHDAELVALRAELAALKGRTDGAL
jgi:hypothetical protein